MAKAIDAFQSFRTHWDSLLAKRGAEPLDQYPLLSLATYGQVFDQWGALIKVLSARGLWESAPEIATADPEISLKLTQLESMVKQALNEGLGWLVGAAEFPKHVTSLQLIFSALAARRIAVTREISRDLEKRGLAEIERVMAADAAATSVMQADQKIKASTELASKSMEVISTAENDATARLGEISRIEAEARRIEAEVRSSAEASKEAQARIEAAQGTIAKLKAEADAREVVLDARVQSLNEKIAALTSDAEAAKESVAQALRAARDQGLAKSFQDRSNILRGERRLWTILFIGAIAVLAVLSAVFVTELVTFKYQELIVAILRKLALAAPCVWLGWYAARQVGRVARVQEDYEYKAASALAFQSYKAEAALGADPDLTKQLLMHAIETFGENPVRLYGDHSTEAVTPLESGLKSLPLDKLIALLTAAINASGGRGTR